MKKLTETIDDVIKVEEFKAHTDGLGTTLWAVMVVRSDNYIAYVSEKADVWELNNFMQKRYYLKNKQ